MACFERIPAGCAKDDDRQFFAQVQTFERRADMLYGRRTGSERHR
jgi:hypothetical protein